MEIIVVQNSRFLFFFFIFFSCGENFYDRAYFLFDFVVPVKEFVSAVSDMNLLLISCIYSGIVLTFTCSVNSFTTGRNHDFKFFYLCLRGWSDGAKVLGKLPVTGRPTNLDQSRARAYCACSRCGWGLFGHFFSHLSFLFSFSLSLGDGPI